MYSLFVGFSVNPEIHVRYPGDSENTKISVPDAGWKIEAGGSALNIQVAASRAGITSKLFAAIGTGGNDRADFFREVMDGFLDNLDVYRLPVRKQDSSVGIIIQPSVGRRRILSHKTPLVPEKVRENVPCLQAQLESCQPAFLVLTGLMPDELELAQPFLNYQGGKIVLAPHVDLIQSGKLLKLLPRVNYLFLNGYERESILGEKPTLDALQRFSYKYGLDWISVTTATHGVKVATQDEQFALPHLESSLPLVDTTGAGDAFLSGTIIALIKGKLAPRTAALYGCCQARLACSREGAANLPPWPEVEQMVTLSRTQ